MKADTEESVRSEGSLHGIAARVVQLVSTRFELLASEIEEERRRALQLLVFVALGASLAQLSVALLTGALILSLNPAWRPLAAAVAGLVFLSAAAYLLRTVLRQLQDRPPPFAATVDELKRDRRWIETLK